MIEPMDLPDAQLVTLDAGAFGATDKDGFPIIKTHKFLVNSPALAQLLHRRLNAQERQMCKPLEGINVTNSQVYPDELVRTILRFVKQEAKKLSPLRFEKPFEVCFAQPVDDEDAWRRILNEVTNTFANSSVRVLTLQPGQELYRKIEEMVPWEIVRVQIAKTPVTRRLPRDIPFTHRGAALLYSAEGMALEAEDLSNVAFPKQRFSKAVQSAVFSLDLQKMTARNKR